MSKTKEPDADCMDCNGSGRVSIPAHLEAGIIINEFMADCHCTLERSSEEYEDDYER